MSYRTDRQRVSGLGSAKEGVHHFWTQRVTSIALIPLIIFFVFPFARNLGGSYESVVATYSNPFNAIVAVLFILVVFRHLQLGLQVIIEDYVSAKATRTVALLLNVLFTWGASLVGVFAILKIAFTA
ncbi:MAG: succinate dehydrogenase, hydrophobic membrane anchor protein [Pseudomonadota bacterium]